MICTASSPFDDSREPQLLDDLIGLDAPTRPLKKALAWNRTPRIIYLTGPTGVGKTTLARLIAKSVMCENRKTGEYEPCGECYNCRAINEKRLWEFQERLACQLTEEDILELKFELLRPGEIIFLDEIQDLSKDLQNLLRGVIDKPQALLIVATTHRHQINDALFSRLKSYEYKLGRPGLPIIVDFFKRDFERFNIKYSSEQQLKRAAIGLHREMRPCAEFPRKVLVETGGELTDSYLDELFGKAGDDNHLSSDDSIDDGNSWGV